MATTSPQAKKPFIDILLEFFSKQVVAKWKLWVAGFVALLIVFGVAAYYLQLLEEQRLQASKQYAGAMRYQSLEQYAEASELFAEIIEADASAGYATLSQLQLAKQHLLLGQETEAESIYLSLMTSSEGLLKDFVLFAYTNMLIAQKRHAEALDALVDFSDWANMIVAELKGDIFYLQGKKQQALQEYNLAIQTYTEQGLRPGQLLSVKASGLQRELAL